MIAKKTGRNSIGLSICVSWCPSAIETFYPVCRKVQRAAEVNDREYALPVWLQMIMGGRAFRGHRINGAGSDALVV